MNATAATKLSLMTLRTTQQVPPPAPSPGMTATPFVYASRAWENDATLPGTNSHFMATAKIVVPGRNQQASRSMVLIPHSMLELPRKFFSKY